MAQADSFPSDALQEIAVDIADWLAASELPTSGVRIAATSLPIWDVKSGPSLQEAATDSGEWHHQILNEDGAFAYARTRVVDGRAEIIGLGESPLVEALEEILGQLRTNAERPVVLRLLRSERHHTTCLWIHCEGGPDEVIALQSQALRVGERFDEQAFLAKLAVLPPPGMIASSPRDARSSDVGLWRSSRAQSPRQVEA